MSERAYHFVGATLRDGSPIPPDGEWLEFSGPCVMCSSELHASREPFDALQYATGEILCLVEIDGIEQEDADLVCRRWRIVARKDVSNLLRSFARQQALSVIHLWDAPAVVRDYLMTGDDKLRSAANAAARSAARPDAIAAAWAAARKQFNALICECFEEVK